MKKTILILIVLLLSSCGFSRNRYHIFSFDDYTIAPGFDDVGYLRLVFELDTDKTLQPNELVEDVDLYFWDKYLASVDIINRKGIEIDTDKAIVKKFDFFLANYEAQSYKLNGIDLSDSVKENCDRLDGEYISTNAPACIIVKKTEGSNKVAILHGDILAIDQDKLARVEIYVE